MDCLELKGTLFWTFVPERGNSDSAFLRKINTMNIRMESLNPDDIKDIDNAPPLERFRRGIKADKTLSSYTTTLKSVLCIGLKNVLHNTYEERVEELVKMAKEDPGRVRNILIMLVGLWIEQTKLKGSDPKYMAPGSIRANLTPVQKLLNMNGVPLAWKMIFGTCPGMSQGSSNPGWTRDDIRRMLQKAINPLTRAAILIMASSGVRSGGLELNWGDIDPVYLKDGKPVTGEDAPEMRGTAEPECAMMIVYRGEPEEYITFMSQEAYKALMKYKANWEEEVGRAPGPKDPVFKKSGHKPIQLRSEMIVKRVRLIAKKAGVQKRSDENGKLYKVPLCNGFRRWFNKNMKDTPADGSIGAFRKEERMIGHLGTMGLDRIYYHAPPMELAAQYLRAVPALTLTDEGLLRIERKKMREDMRKVKKEFAALQRKQKTRTDTAERQNADREAISTKEEMKDLKMMMEDIMKRLNMEDEEL